MPAVQYREPYPAATRGDRWHVMTDLRRRLGLGPHRGQDWAPGDVPAVAIADGVIVAKYPVAKSSVLGNVVVVRHADGLYAGYCHLAVLPTAAVGSKVERGKSIGAHVGNTGSASGGRHLHLTLAATARGVFEGDTLDPLAHILAHDAPVAPAAAAAKASEVKRSVLVKDGDTLSKIATRVGTTWQKLAAKNGLKAPYVIKAGQKLTLP